MTKMLVEDTSLTTVANAIRTKGGTTGALTFPNGFVSAVNGIKTGTNYAPSIIDGSITKITEDMLEGCTLIQNYAFYGRDNLTSVSLPSSVTELRMYAFSGCRKLTSVSLPSSLTKISSYAFSNCIKLAKITIPSSVTSISSYAFSSCNKLATVEMKPKTPPTLGSKVFETNSSVVTTIKVPKSSLSAYQSATNWSVYADQMVGV